MIRKIFFWTHLVSGLVAGLVIAFLALTGLVLSFEPQIVDWAERDIRAISRPEAGAEKSSIEELMTFIREEYPDARPAGFTVYADPEAAVVIPAGRGLTFHVDPYTTEIKEAGSARLREFFNLNLSLHRYLAMPGGVRGIGGQITGVTTFVLLALSLTGLVIWWPRKWNWRSIKPSVWFVGARGKLRDWNWHNVIGLWTTPLLIVVCITGLMISYRWVGDLAYVLTGNPVPPARGQANPGANEDDTAGNNPPPANQPRSQNETAPVNASATASAAMSPETASSATRAVVVPAPPPGTRPQRYEGLLASVRQTYPDWTQITLRPPANPRPGRGGNRNAAAAQPAVPAVAAAAAQPAAGTASFEVQPTAAAATTAASADAPAAPPAPRDSRQSAGRAPSARSARILPAVTMIVRTRDMWFSTSSITLSLDPYTGDILRTEGFTDQNLGRRLRALAKPVHMGTILGWPTQLLAALVTLGALFLVYTGFALSWRRFFGKNARAKTAKSKRKPAA